MVVVEDCDGIQIRRISATVGKLAHQYNYYSWRGYCPKSVKMSVLFVKGCARMIELKNIT